MLQLLSTASYCPVHYHWLVKVQVIILFCVFLQFETVFDVYQTSVGRAFESSNSFTQSGWWQLNVRNNGYSISFNVSVKGFRLILCVAKLKACSL